MQDMCVSCVLSFPSCAIKVCAVFFVLENAYAVMHIQCLTVYAGQKTKDIIMVTLVL